MSSNEGNFNRASRKYLTKIGYITPSRPQLWLNGTQLQGIAGQQRSERKHKGNNGAADLEYDAAILEYYMPSQPKSKPVISKRGGKKKKTQRKSKHSKQQPKKRKTKRRKSIRKLDKR